MESGPSRFRSGSMSGGLTSHKFRHLFKTNLFVYGGFVHRRLIRIFSPATEPCDGAEQEVIFEGVDLENAGLAGFGRAAVPKSDVGSVDIVFINHFEWH